MHENGLRNCNSGRKNSRRCVSEDQQYIAGNERGDRRSVESFYNEGIYASIPKKANAKALGIYTDYAGDEKADYTALVACETAELPAGNDYAVCRIPAGKYAKFVVHGNMVQAVAEAWQTIWQMELPRSFQCDFEEYQNDDMGDNAEVHIYIGLKE